jgi:Holliday junction resolvase RusA-like endonuclease
MRQARTVRRRLVWVPRAKQRPKTTFKNGHPRTFTPRPTIEAEHALAAQWVGQPVAGPLAVTIVMTDTYVDVAVTPCDEPLSPKLRRGDIDNYTKLICDALNGVAWLDDRQIARILVVKE